MRPPDAKRPGVGSPVVPASHLDGASSNTDSSLGVTIPLECAPCPMACSPSACATPRCSVPWSQLEREVLAAVEHVDGIEVLR